jgi:hypothetical protein
MILEASIGVSQKQAQADTYVRMLSKLVESVIVACIDSGKRGTGFSVSLLRLFLSRNQDNVVTVCRDFLLLHSP